LAATDPKQIKLQLVVDEASFRKLTDVVRQATREVTKLVEELNKAGAAFGRSQPGATPFVSASGKPINQQAGGGLQSATATVSSGVSATGTNIAKALMDNKNLLRSISAESKEAMKAMAEAVGESVNKQAREVQRLRDNYKQLAEAYKSAKADAAGGGFFGEAASGRLPGLRDQLGEAGIDLAKGRKEWEDQSNAYRELTGQGGGGAGRSGRGARAGGTDGDRFAQGLSQVASGSPLGGLLTMLGTKAGIAGLALAGAHLGMQVGGNALQSNMQEQLMQPFDVANIRGKFGQNVGRVAQSTRKGDWKYAYSLWQMQQNGELGDLRTIASPENIVKNSAGGIKGANWTEKFGLALSDEINGPRVQKAISESMGGANAGGLWSKFVADRTGTEARLARNMKNIPVEMTSDVVARVQKNIEAQPELMGYLDEYAGGTKERLDTQRGYGVGRRRKFNPATGVVETNDPAQDRAIRAHERGWSTGEDVGMAQALRAAGGWGINGLSVSALSRQAGGLIGASQLYGGAAQMPGTTAEKWISAISGMHGARGAGGIDQTAISSLAQMVQGTTMGAGNMTTGLPFLGGLQNAGFAQGATPGEDVYRSRQLANGMGIVQGGPMDPLQRGIDVYAANRAFGDKSIYARRFAESRLAYDPTLMAQALSAKSGDQLPLALRQRGFDDPSKIRQFVEERNRFSLVRFLSSNQGNGSDQMTRFAQRVRDEAGGDPFKWIHEKAAGMTGKAKKKFLNDATFMLGNLNAAVKGDKSTISDETGAARALYAGFFPGELKKLGGIGDPAAKSAEIEQEKAKAEDEKKREKTVNDLGDSGLRAIPKMLTPLADSMYKAGTSFTTAAQEFEVALEGMTEIMLTTMGKMNSKAAAEYRAQVTALREKAHPKKPGK
jgi:hypothetical protein